MTELNQHSLAIKPLSEADFEHWLMLWQAYLSFYKTSLTRQVTNTTWLKILDTNVPIYGIGAYLNNELVGIAHVVLHPNTWNISDCCYFEDMFVEQNKRGLGIGRALIKHVYEFAKAKGCNRVYWVTNEDNMIARQLYESVANKTNMVQYRHDL